MFPRRLIAIAALFQVFAIPNCWATSITLVERHPTSGDELHLRVETDQCFALDSYRVDRADANARLAIVVQAVTDCTTTSGVFEIGKWPAGTHEVIVSISRPREKPRFSSMLSFHVRDVELVGKDEMNVGDAHKPDYRDRYTTSPPPHPAPPTLPITLPPQPYPPARAELGVQNNYYTLPVYFATDRELTQSAGPQDRFGAARGNKIQYGICQVSIPRDHRIGEIESPSWWRLQFKPDPEKHIVILSADLKTNTDFFGSLSTQLKASKDGMLVFVHGFNVTFDDAAKRTAQLAFDLNFSTPIFFSWPSNGKVQAYVADQENAEWAQDDLRQFLNDLLNRAPDKKVFLLAHSMGSRVLMRAIAGLIHENPERAKRLTAIMLAAPDIDVGIFQRDIAPVVATIGRVPTTIYASSKDLALDLSEELHQYRRLGESGDNLVIVKGIDTIDASAIDHDGVIGHSYFATERAMIDDLHEILFAGLPADNRSGLVKMTKDHGSSVYWAFKP